MNKAACGRGGKGTILHGTPANLAGGDVRTRVLVGLDTLANNADCLATYKYFKAA